MYILSISSDESNVERLINLARPSLSLHKVSIWILVVLQCQKKYFIISYYSLTRFNWGSLCCYSLFPPKWRLQPRCTRTILITSKVVCFFIYICVYACVFICVYSVWPCRVGSVGSVSASRTVGREFASRPGHTKDHHKMVQTASLHRHACVMVGVWQCSPTV